MFRKTFAGFALSVADTLAHAIPNAERRTLHGQAHEVKPEAIAPVLVEFFSANAG